MKKSKKVTLTLISGLLLGLSFPPLPFFLLAFIGFIPLLFLLIKENDLKHKYFYIYLTFFIYHASTNWWIGSWRQESDPYLTASAIALAIVHPFFFMIPFAAFLYIKRKVNSFIALNIFPFLWTSFEWLHSLGEFSYPWLTIGNTQIYNSHWVQFIDITGVWGASLLIAVVNVIILNIILNYRNNRHTTFKSLVIENKLHFISLLVIIALPVIYSFYSLNKWNNAVNSANTIKVGIIQPAVNPWQKWDMSVDDQILMQMKLQDSLKKAVPDIDLMIWSETSIPRHINLSEKFDYQFLQYWADKNKTSLMTGFAEIQIFKEENASATARYFRNDSSMMYESYNSAMLLNPGKENITSYRKMRLTPLAERLPYADYLLFMRSWFEWGVGISAWGIGREQKNLIYDKEKKIHIAPIICIESVYPDFVRNFSAMGAGIFTVITNDAWYDYTPGPRQHYLIAAMRAIENRRAVARCANTGISGVLLPTGKSLGEIPQYERTASSWNVPILTEKTLYTILGDWAAQLSLILSLIFLIFGKYIIKKV